MEVSETEFERAINGLTKAMESGFKGVHQRQDVTNGRLNKHEDMIHKLDVEMAERRGRDTRLLDDDKPLLTNRDGKLIKMIWGLVAALAGAAAYIITHWKP